VEPIQDDPYLDSRVQEAIRSAFDALFQADRRESAGVALPDATVRATLDSPFVLPEALRIVRARLDPARE
jgi:hypothetical protein